ncbi:MAG TPA: hypothetical protein VF041_02785 [Gemmatimonadaceae bacterium]
MRSFRDEWRESYGRWWWLDLAALALLVFALGAVKPLDDPDLPMHLATGEWIVRHHAVPFVEPFAWTRAGAPYFAYSWLLEVLYYGMLRWFGPIGLHVLNGILVVAVGAATLVLGHAARWRPWISLALAAFGIGVANMIVASLRPQLVLLSLVPLAWALGYRVLQRERPGAPLAALCLVSAVAANSHLFFVLTALPLSLVFVVPGATWRRTLAMAVAIGAGWLLTPYALAWPAVFRLNFGYNALLVHPSPINEFRPGFSSGFFGLAFAAALAVIPWGIGHDAVPQRERRVHAALWLAGLVSFAFAVRLLMVWWLAVLPAAAIALATTARVVPERPPRPVVRAATYLVASALLVALSVHLEDIWRGEGTVATRRLPVSAARSIEPLLDWLACNTAPEAGGRIFTWFNYGSYLAWRLPSYSESIDGRTIFPDSVARAEVLSSGWLAPKTFATWSSADVAIVPRRFRVAAELDRAPQWRLVAWSYESPDGSSTVGLWVRRDWWARMGRGQLPGRVRPLLASWMDPTPACAAPARPSYVTAGAR